MKSHESSRKNFEPDLAWQIRCQYKILWTRPSATKKGFDERIRGSHHIFTREGVEEILNLQAKDSKSKLYQVKQVRNVILKYKLGEQKDD